MNSYLLVALFSGLCSAAAQILLKKSSERAKQSPGTGKSALIHEYLNVRVLVAYGITGLCMLLMIYAYRGITYQTGVILETLTYPYIMILSRLFLGEKITWKRLLGNGLVVGGVLVFML